MGRAVSTLRLSALRAVLLSLAALAVLPAVARAADSFADASRPNNNGDCLTPATACKTIGGPDGALAKATAGFAVHVEPGTYAENVTLNTGVSLVADSGNPVIEPATGPAVTVTGGPGPHITGLTFASSAAGPEVILRDAAGNAIVGDNSFIDRTPADDNAVTGIRTTSTGAPKIANNSFTLLQDGVDVLPPATGAPGRPEITANIIVGTQGLGSGISVESTNIPGVTGPTTAVLTGNDIEQGGPESIGVSVLDRGSAVGDPSVPGAGATLVRNRILGGGNGLVDFGARAPLTLFGDVIARTGSVSDGRSPIRAFQTVGLGGQLTVTNADLVANPNPAIQLSGIHINLDSSIVAGSIFQEDGADCTITFSAGLTGSGNSCQTFQAIPPVRFLDQENSDFHLDPALDLALIDHGNPATPPLEGMLDLDGDPRVIDGACPIGAVRDIGADEFNPGALNCAPSDPPGGGGVAGTPPAGGTQASRPSTGKRASALKRCKRKHGNARRSCIRKARLLPL